MKKWTIRVLLGFLGLLLFLLFLPLILLLVFAPFRYAVVARKDDGLTVRAKASYLFRFITYRFLLKNGQSVSQLRILGIRVGGKKRQPAKSVDVDAIIKEAQETKQTKPEAAASPEPETPKSGKGKLRSILTYPELKTIIKLVFSCIKKFLRKLLPKRLDISGTFGFDDPAATGMCLGAYESVVTMLNLRERIRLAADFAEPGIKLRVAASGKFSAAGLMQPMISLLMKKKIRQFIRFIRKG